MRYFCYNHYDPEDSLADETGVHVKVMSEEEIKHEYWPYWHERMCAKFGKKHVDKNYCWQDCLQDWIIVHWAWESD